MASDDHSNDQKRLFPVDETGAGSDSQEDDFSPEGDSLDDESPSTDYASEEERLRNGDIAFRPVSLPEPEPAAETRKRGTGGTALMIVIAIAVVLMLTWAINTFYSTSPSGPESATVTPDGKETIEQPGSGMADPGIPDQRQAPAGEPAAMFQAHAELQGKYRQAESRIAELETELKTLRAGSPAPGPGGEAAGADPDRLAQLVAENKELKTGRDQIRRESEAAISRAEQLVTRSEAQVAEERGRTRTAREETEQARRQTAALTDERDLLTSEQDSLLERQEQLESELARTKVEYDRLAASTTTRLEGESEAVRQLISRHSQELETERKATREKETEIQRLKTLIARLSVADPGTRSTEPTSTARSGSTAAGSPSTAGGVDTAPRILTRSEPEYPVNARRLRVEGTVLLNVLVGIDGKVREVKVLEAEGGKLLSPSAVEAVRKWIFTPATRSGRAVECWHKVPIRFAL